MDKLNILEDSKIVIPLIEEAIEAAKPGKYLKNVKIQDKMLHYKDYEIKFENIYLIAVGKAAISMVRPFLDIKLKERVIVSIEKNGIDDVIVSSHPLSSESGYLGAKKIVNLLSKATENDLILFLLSGGASAILGDYIIPVEQANSLFSDLMRAGADIFELNAVRKHLSFLKGGRVVKLTKAKILSLIVSDVMGDDLSTIGSGPTYFDSYTFNDAIKVMEKFKLDIKYLGIMDMLRNPEKYGISETLKRDEFPEDRVFNEIICNNEKSLKAVENKGREMGYYVFNLGTVVSGEAKIVSKELYKKFLELEEKSIMVSGGEPVVTVKGTGKGGRSQEFVLSLVPFIGRNEIIASFGTDGIDGVTDAAGAVADYSTRKFAENMDIEKYLENNDSYNFFKKSGNLIITGPTGTNVMDVQIFIRK